MAQTQSNDQLRQTAKTVVKGAQKAGQVTSQQLKARRERIDRMCQELLPDELMEYAFSDTRSNPDTEASDYAFSDPRMY